VGEGKRASPAGQLLATTTAGEGADRALPHRLASLMDHILDRAHRYPSSGALTEVRGGDSLLKEDGLQAISVVSL
jgi:hypothetical protein